MINGDDIAPLRERHPVRALQMTLGAQLRAQLRTLLAPVVEQPLPTELTLRLDQLDRPRRRPRE
jgi:hypothetical protein